MVAAVEMLNEIETIIESQVEASQTTSKIL